MNMLMKLPTALATLTLGFAMPALAELSDDSPCIPGETVLLSDGSADAALAADAADPLLTLTGKDGAQVMLSAAQLGALPQYAIATENEYLDGMNCYSGPLGRDVLALIGAAEGDGVMLTAINDYAVEAPYDHMAEYDVMFTTAINGDALSVRDKGPIWVVYPQSDNAILRDTLYSTFMVWQLNRVDLN